MNITRKLNEGGAMPGVGPIHISEIEPTLNALEKILKIDLKNNVLGSVGKKEFSGDIDVALDLPADEIPAFLEKLKSIPEIKDIAKSSVIMTKVEIVGYDPDKQTTKPRTGYVQVDFMLGEPSWLKTYYHSPSETESKYKGVYRNIMIATIAALYDREDSAEKIADGRSLESERWMWSPTDGLVRINRKPEPNKAGTGYTKKNINKVIKAPVKNAEEIAKTLGLDSAKDLNSYESLKSAIEKNYPSDLVKKILDSFASNPQITALGVPEDLKVSVNESDQLLSRIKQLSLVESVLFSTTDSIKDISTFRNIIVENSILMEAGPRIPHPEDAIFDGSAEAKKYLEALKQAIDDPKSGSIKWDGGIALFFGRLDDGTFVVADKYMPDKGVFPKSPQEWIQYDQSRGANRADLYDKIKLIWPGLEQAVGNNKGLFKGDLLFTGRLKPTKGYYVFSPVTVEYRIPVSSDMGKMLKDKVGAVVVHQFNDKPWSGNPPLESTSVALIEPKAGIDFNIKKPTKLIQNAEQVINKYGDLADRFFESLPKTVKDAIRKFANHQITKQTTDTLLPWLEKNVSAKQYEFLVGNNDGYLIQNKAGIDAVFAIWNAIYQLKLNVAQQLESQVTGFEQWSGGKQEGEGFVFPTNAGLVKIVNREGFGAAHFNK
jgi:hypothetical protein